MRSVGTVHISLRQNLQWNFHVPFGKPETTSQRCLAVDIVPMTAQSGGLTLRGTQTDPCRKRSRILGPVRSEILALNSESVLIPCFVTVWTNLEASTLDQANT